MKKVSHRGNIHPSSLRRRFSFPSSHSSPKKIKMQWWLLFKVHFALSRFQT